MDQYASSYTSIVPRLLPSQYSAKKIPMVEEGYQYVDIRPPSSRVSPPMNQNNLPPMSTRTQLMNNEINPQENPWPNQTFPSNNSDKLSLNGRTKGRFHLEALKDNSGDVLPTYPYSTNGYPPINDNRPYEYFKPNLSQQQNKCPIVFIIIFAIFIGLFAITALAISIYLLVKMSNTS